MRLKSPDASIEELKQLVEQGGREPLSEEDRRKLAAFIETYKTMVERLEAGNLTIEQARALWFGEDAGPSPGTESINED